MDRVGARFNSLTTLAYHMASKRQRAYTVIAVVVLFSAPVIGIMGTATAQTTEGPLETDKAKWQTSVEGTVIGLEQAGDSIYAITDVGGGGNDVNLYNINKNGQIESSVTFSGFSPHSDGVNFRQDNLEYYESTNSLYMSLFNDTSSVNGFYQIQLEDNSINQVHSSIDGGVVTTGETGSSEYLVFYNPFDDMMIVEENGETIRDFQPGGSFSASGDYLSFHDESATAWYYNPSVSAYNVSSESMVFEGKSVGTPYLQTLSGNSYYVINESYTDQYNYYLKNYSTNSVLTGEPEVNGSRVISTSYEEIQQITSNNEIAIVTTSNQLSLYANGVQLKQKFNLTTGSFTDPVPNDVMIATNESGGRNLVSGVSITGGDNNYVVMFEGFTVESPTNGNGGNGGGGSSCLQNLSGTPTVQWLPCYLGTGILSTTFQWLITGLLVSYPIANKTNSDIGTMATIDGVLAVGMLVGPVSPAYVAIGVITTGLLASDDDTADVQMTNGGI